LDEPILQSVVVTFVIVGAGAVGLEVARQLIEEKRDVVLIERDVAKARYASNNLDCMVINDESSNLETLRKAGVKKAEYFISLTESDEMNMILCGLVAREFNVPYRIARIRNIDYSAAGILDKNFLGIDCIVNPAVEAGRSIVRAIEHGAVSDIMFFQRSTVQMRNLSVGDSDLFVGRSLADARSRLGLTFLVAVIVRGNEAIIPAGDTVIQPFDNLYILADEQEFDLLLQAMGKFKLRLNKIVVVGGGSVGQFVLDSVLRDRKVLSGRLQSLLGSLLRRGKRNISVIDQDYRRCKDLSQRFPEALVINGDISAEHIFEEEGLADADAIVCTTGNQELNIVTSVYAKTLGVKRAVALVSKNSYVHIASNLGIDAPVSMQNSMVGSILKFIRHGNIDSVHNISGGDLEVVEMPVQAASRLAGKMVREIKFPPETLILALTRDAETVIPEGTNTLSAGDNVIFIARKESTSRIERMFGAPA